MDLMQSIRDPAAMRNGEWQKLGPEWGEVEVLVRAQGGAYVDDLAARRRTLARKHGGMDNIPTEAESEAITEATIKCLLMDVRGGPGDSIGGKPINRESFAELMRHPGAVGLVNAVLSASGRVGYAREEAREEAAGNSQPPSATS